MADRSFLKHPEQAVKTAASPRAFSVVELLVVVTIITLLLALLGPAVDRAVYQAQLALCAANFKGISTAAGVYTGDYGRSYPNHARTLTWEPCLLAATNQIGRAS